MGRDDDDESVRTIHAALDQGMTLIDTAPAYDQVHWPDAATPHEETAAALVELKRQGKIRAIGVSNYSIPEMERFRSLAPLASAQPPLNLFEQQSLADVIPWCRDHGVATLTYGALCRGLLTGEVDESTEFRGDDLRNEDPKFRPSR